MTSEKVLETSLRNIAKNQKGIAIKLLSTITGLPDRMCLFPGGRIIFIELKTTGKKPRKTQLIIHDKLRALGFRVEVIDDPIILRKIMKEYE